MLAFVCFQFPNYSEFIIYVFYSYPTIRDNPCESYLSDGSTLKIVIFLGEFPFHHEGILLTFH